ncbi:RNA polymerase sigma-70 factor [uncultured Parabacteroides sp.]|jgi:RNA polymerase sigma-70 factor (ECF subfamily)|uniref:RNA polymerase sigma-70 factor n=1 Tax=uncultured Parabacteroides sp. TaxID=512312 RepID=UPI0025CD986C|nr:RNA polymerase sigma-70 factor [uncultured Parabacteroides sp.]
METASEIKAFNKLFADYHGLFVRFANTYIQDEAAAEDIAVEGIMYYWENRRSLTSDSNIPAYILEAIKHKCLNYLRHLRVREDVEQRIREHQERVNDLRISTLEACDPQEIFSSEAQQLVDEALAMMSGKTRQIFIMSRYENKTYPEIAAHLSLSVKSVEFHISKALKILRVKLQDYMAMILFL